MNVNSGGPHILLFERDQQLTALLSGELGLAGYEVHAARTAVEVFDAIARFPIRLVMVNLAQAQAGRREFWVALDAQRRGRGVQVFTFRCANLGGYGPEDPEERVDTVLTDLEVEGMLGIVKLVDAVRARVPGPTTASVTSVRPAPAMNMPQEGLYGQSVVRPVEMPPSPQASPVYVPPPPPVMNMPQEGLYSQSAVRPVEPPYPPQASPVYAPPPAVSHAQPLQGTLRPLPPEMSAPPPPARPVEPPRSGPSTFTDKIRAVIYPNSRSFSAAPEANGASYNPGVQYQYPDAQPRPQPVQRFAEAEYPPNPSKREEMTYQSPAHSLPADQAYPSQNGSPSGSRPVSGESGLDQLSRMLRESQPALQSVVINGNTQNATPRPGISVDPQELQEMRSQIMQAARQDEAYERSNSSQARPPAPSTMGAQLRASPIQDVPFEQEIANRRGATSGPLQQPSEAFARPAMPVQQPMQMVSPAQQQAQFSPAQGPSADGHAFSESNTQPRPATLPESPIISTAASSQIRQLSPLHESAPHPALSGQQISGPLSLNDLTLPEQMQASIQRTLSRRPEVKTSDDMLLDIVKSLPPMSPAPQPPPQPQVLNGRATRSLGSVLLEGHLVPEERLQVAQHVQRMLRGVDLNYQLGEILLMFKLLTPDQLLAASLVSYGMISTMQITSLGRIRQELHSMGLEYDLESLLVVFRILTPEQLREVRASWSS